MSSASIDELTEENGAPTLGTQNQAVDFILADPELCRAVADWAADRQHRRGDDGAAAAPAVRRALRPGPRLYGAHHGAAGLRSPASRIGADRRAHASVNRPARRAISQPQSRSREDAARAEL